MAKRNVAQQQRRLKLKSEELQIRVRQDENRKKLAEIRDQLKQIGGRIR